MFCYFALHPQRFSRNKILLSSRLKSTNINVCNIFLFFFFHPISQLNGTGYRNGGIEYDDISTAEISECCNVNNLRHVITPLKQWLNWTLFTYHSPHFNYSWHPEEKFVPYYKRISCECGEMLAWCYSFLPYQSCKLFFSVWPSAVNQVVWE